MAMGFDRQPAVDITLDDLASDPYDALAEMCHHSPVVWIPAIDGWMVTSRELVLEAMRDPDRFTVDDSRFSTAQVVGTSMLSLDGAEHRRHRTPFVGRFRRGPIDDEFRGWLRLECERRVRDLVAGGHSELRRDLAGPLAVATISRVLGLQRVAEAELLGWYRSIVASVVAVTAGEAVPHAGRAAVAGLKQAVLHTARIENGSWLSDVAASGGLDDEELVSNVAVLLFGAIETSEGATATALWHVLSSPEWLHRLRVEANLITGAVEESLRLEPAASVVDRYAVADTVLGDVEIPHGDLVRLSLLAANRDPTEFDDPHRFDPLRPNAGRHLTFVQGPHACLGLHLARLEAQAALGAVVMAEPPVVLVDSDSIGPAGLVFRKPESVSVRW